ncbi:hypothetical protein [Gordonia sp. UCD-TK1]|uniref:hypothetical protein n=1 Tax=Gordonia sp. UCD-TK1 TaxID=1857893 RepID=UPI00080DB73C|nr:hypothetical protein [Gordonia sp. UCD-TK1]OCH80189.1 hypothetical protein A9310_22465 [Gordonia sp. UCD-TK1]
MWSVGIVDSVFEDEVNLRAPDAKFIAAARADVPALVARVRELEDAIERAMEECRKTGEHNAHAKHLNIRSARLLAVEVLHILGGAS